MPRFRKGLGGPKTTDGKAVSSLNAMKHGILSSQAVLKTEDPEALKQLVAGLHAQFEPVGESNAALPKRLAQARERREALGAALVLGTLRDLARDPG